jgi:SAM-dependent methyltransferase
VAVGPGDGTENPNDGRAATWGRPYEGQDLPDPHAANRAFWDASTPWWKEKEDARGLWRRAHLEPSRVLSAAEMPFLKNVRGKDVCVLGSGDNEAAFALAGLGGRITSVDISAERLAVAAERARTLGLQLTFLRADVTDLAALEDGRFDLVYTGGHMSVWVSDIRTYYAEAVRILRPGGLFVVSEYHPVRRMWLDADGPKPRHRYLDRGPYRYTSPEGLPTFEYHWTAADHIQAAVDAGCRLVKVDEHGDSVADEFWMAADLDGLPAHLLIVGRKHKAGNRKERKERKGKPGRKGKG